MNTIDDDFIKLVFQTLENNNTIFTQINMSISDIKEILNNYNQACLSDDELYVLDEKLNNIKQLLSNYNNLKLDDQVLEHINDQLDEKFKSFSIWTSGILLVIGLTLIFLNI
jgi:regulator of sigma D